MCIGYRLYINMLLRKVQYSIQTILYFFKEESYKNSIFDNNIKVIIKKSMVKGIFLSKVKFWRLIMIKSYLSYFP